ncbi:hypothetical protein LQW54_007614 [Pestalotiopsis sp. IQ-011]
MNFIKAEIFDQAVEHQYEPDEKTMDLLGTSKDDDDNEHRLNEPETSGPGLETGDSYEMILTQRPVTEGNSSDYSKVVLYEWALKHQADTKGPSGIMPIPSDDQFVNIADHLKLQMAVTKCARLTLSDPSLRSQTRPVPTWSDDKERDEYSLERRPDNQWSYHSDDSMSHSGVESMADAPEPMEGKPESDWRLEHFLARAILNLHQRHLNMAMSSIQTSMRKLTRIFRGSLAITGNIRLSRFLIITMIIRTKTTQQRLIQ